MKPVDKKTEHGTCPGSNRKYFNLTHLLIFTNMVGRVFRCPHYRRTGYIILLLNILFINAQENTHINMAEETTMA
jgi:hypothetical protein